ITPELPRAPMSEPWATALQTVTLCSALPGSPSIDGEGSEVSSPSKPSRAASAATTDSRVRAMFVPVSPSGTGYTFKALSASWWSRRTCPYVAIVAARWVAPSLLTDSMAVDANLCARPNYLSRSVRVVAAVCEVCGKHPSFGMNLSHSNRRTKRRWDPNIQRVRALVNGSPRRLHV